MVEHAQYRSLVGRCAAYVMAGAAFATPVFADCRQALVLGLDVSASVDAADYRLQLDGLAAALDAPVVRDLILNGGEAPVHLSIFEWSGVPNPPRLLVQPTPVIAADILDDIIAILRSENGRSVAGSTDIGAAIIAGLELVQESEDCWRRVIDLSGDGQANIVPPPSSIVVPPGVTINGLVIGGMPGMGDDRLEDIKELSSYYRVNVIRGPDAFVETALGFADFEAAMTRKLIRELQGVPLGMIATPDPVRVAELDQ